MDNRKIGSPATAARIARVAVLALALVATGPLLAVAGASGDPTLSTYLAADPVGGVPLPTSELQALVTSEQAAGKAVASTVSVADAGWENARTRSSLIDLLVAFPIGFNLGGASGTRAFVTEACLSLGGKAGAIRLVRSLVGARQVTCTQRGGATLDIVGTTHANVLIGLFGSLSKRFPVRSFDAATIRQYRLIPAAGVPPTT